MLYIPLALGLCLYATAFFVARLVLRNLKSSQHYTRIWAGLLVSTLGWLAVVFAIWGDGYLHLLRITFRDPDENIWAMKFIGLFSLFIVASPVPLAIALSTVRPDGRWWRTRSFLALLSVGVVTLGAAHFSFHRTCLLSIRDQFGNPVPNAFVTYYLDGRAKRPTDASGMLRIPYYRYVHRLDICEASAGGFVINEGLSSHRPFAPIPANVTIPAWKVLRAPQMLSSRPHIPVVSDGQPHFINILHQQSGQEPLAFVDLEVRVQAPADIRGIRYPSEEKRFPWSVDIRVPDGGLLPASGTYQYLAPETGYVESIKRTFDVTDAAWNSSYSETFYLKLRGGKAFAVAEVTVTSLYIDKAIIFVDAKVNPAAERNLFWGYGNFLHSEHETTRWLSHLYGPAY